jgi:hypothetical protein
MFKRLKARIVALLPEQWRGDAGKRFRETIDAMSEYSGKNIRIKEKLQEAPSVLWETAKIKSSQALVNAAEEEQRRIDTELARRTLADKARQEKATADKLESDARVSIIVEMEARLQFVEKMRGMNIVPVWNSQGQMTFVKTPPAFDWDGITQRLITTRDLGQIVPPDVPQDEPKLP